MITLRPANERGHARYSWLDTRHTFSFADYYDPRFMGVSDLRVLNDDRVKGGAGFETHGHRDMEIISYILDGTIEHKDTMNIHTQLKAGEVQVMSAGTGIMHSEYNPSASDSLHFLQIWIMPNHRGGKPRYAQKDFSTAQGITLIVSPDGKEDSLPIHQDACIHQVKLRQQSANFTTSAGRIYFLHIARGTMRVNGTLMSTGDGATIQAENLLHFDVDDHVEALLIDLRTA